MCRFLVARILVAVIVEDNSPDGTREVAKKLQESYGRSFITVLERPGKLGLGTAYMAALSLVQSEYTILMDSDLSHHPKFIPAMIKKMEGKGCDVVTGTRYRDGGGVAGWDMKRKVREGLGAERTKHTSFFATHFALAPLPSSAPNRS